MASESNTAIYRGRIAPSPTGLLHLGHARTFLLTWLRARTVGGVVVLRIEDLDGPRVVPGSADQICRDLEWLGLTWDEGPVFQSERLEQYEEAFRMLRQNGTLFPCTCSRREIALVASAHPGKERLERVYPGTCRNGPTQPSRRPSYRLRVAGEPPSFRELLYPEVTPVPFGDFVVRRADGVFSYQLASAVDDGEMRISEVVRGADLLSSTPKQVSLLGALGFSAPTYLHIPLLLGNEGAKLSKRDGVRPIRQLAEAGWEPEAVLGRLGQTLGIETGRHAAAADMLPLGSLDTLVRTNSIVSEEFLSGAKTT